MFCCVGGMQGGVEGLLFKFGVAGPRLRVREEQALRVQRVQAVQNYGSVWGRPAGRWEMEQGNQG